MGLQWKAADYASFKAILDSSGFAGRIYYCGTQLTVSSWVFQAAALDYCTGFLVLLEATGNVDQTPKTFQADLANAIKLTYPIDVNGF